MLSFTRFLLIETVFKQTTSVLKPHLLNFNDLIRVIFENIGVHAKSFDVCVLAL
jgi:hypothetical protein